MDSWKKHLKLGLFLEIPFILTFFFWKNWFVIDSYILVIQILIIIFVSPLIIDIDHKQSKLREWLTILGLVLGIVGVIVINIKLMSYGIIISSISFLPVYFTKHRNIMHSVSFCIFYGGCIYLLVNNVELAILGIFGTYTHMIGDKLFFKIF